MNAADLQTATDLTKQLSILTSRRGQIKDAATVRDLFNLLDGTLLTDQALVQARLAVDGFFDVAIRAVQARLTALGVTVG